MNELRMNKFKRVYEYRRALNSRGKFMIKLCYILNTLKQQIK